MDAAAPPVSWRDSLIVTKKGQPLANVANAITALKDAPDWQGVLSFDVFRNRTIMQRPAPWANGTAPAPEWATEHDVLTAAWLQHAGIQVSPDTAAQAVETVARHHKFHPVLDYLARCKWDGVERIDRWTIDHLGAEDTPYARAVSARWLISAVARVHQPGCKSDCALILEGEQGTRKSTALRTIAAPWFTDEIADLGNKDSAQQLPGVWIIELAELDAVSKADVSKIKAFMSRSTDRYRPSYGKRIVELPRQCVFAGTVNGNQYLRDETGGRRFWPLACTTINIQALASVRDQLWAEACHQYHKGAAWWLDERSLLDAAVIEQRARYTQDAWEDAIKSFVVGRPHVSVDLILREVIHPQTDIYAPVDISKWSQSDQTRVGRCLASIGWTRKQVRTTEGRPHFYFPPSPLDQTGDKPVTEITV